MTTISSIDNRVTKARAGRTKFTKLKRKQISKQRCQEKYTQELKTEWNPTKVCTSRIQSLFNLVLGYSESQLLQKGKKHAILPIINKDSMLPNILPDLAAGSGQTPGSLQHESTI